jgi:hypothetical protein
LKNLAKVTGILKQSRSPEPLCPLSFSQGGGSSRVRVMVGFPLCRWGHFQHAAIPLCILVDEKVRDYPEPVKLWDRLSHTLGESKSVSCWDHCRNELELSAKAAAREVDSAVTPRGIYPMGLLGAIIKSVCARKLIIA